MAEGYARSTGKPGVVLVTSGPGATNVVTAAAGRADGFDPAGLHHRPGPDLADRLDAFQECDTVGITRPCTKHNWLVKDVNQLPRVMHEAFSASPPPAVPGRSLSTSPRTSSSPPAPTPRRRR
jgi:acetolactate synthase-1/2/3 large subunit